MTAPGSAASQVALISMLERYERAEKLSNLFPNVELLWKEADKRHDDLLRAALLCGYMPGGSDGGISTLAWAQRRVGLILRVMPKHVEEGRGI